MLIFPSVCQQPSNSLYYEFAEKEMRTKIYQVPNYNASLFFSGRDGMEVRSGRNIKVGRFAEYIFLTTVFPPASAFTTSEKPSDLPSVRQSLSPPGFSLDL